MPNPEAVITDESTALHYLRAQETFQGAAIDAIRDEGGLKAVDPSEAGAIVRFSGETHDVAIKVLAETMAPSGLMKALRRKSINVDVRTTITDHSLPDQPPVQLYLNAIRSGRRHLLEPRLTGAFILPMETSGEWPKGVLDSKLSFIGRLESHQYEQHPVDSFSTLQNTLNLLTNSLPEQFLSTVEALGEADAALEFMGKEVQRGKDIINPLLQAIQSRYSDRLQPNLYRVLRERDFSSLHLTNDLSQAGTDCPIEIVRYLTETAITLCPPASWDPLPRALQVMCPISDSMYEPRTYSFLDAEGRGLPLTREQRKLLLRLLEEKLGNIDQFDIKPRARDVLLPDDSVLAACDKLVGTEGKWNGAVVIGQDEHAPPYRVWLQRDKESFVCIAQQPGSGPMIFGFDKAHYDTHNYSGAPEQAVRQLLLQIYDSLTQRANELDK